MNEFVRQENGIGILKINGKELITPLFFPTLMFNSEKLRKIDDICQDLSPHITNSRLVNLIDVISNTNFKVKRYILTFVDSGGFRLKEDGAKILPEKLKIIWQGKEIGVEEVLKVQSEKGDIGNTLDFPISQNLRNKDEYVRFNLNCAIQSLKAKPVNLFLYGTIQAWDYDSAIEYSKRIVNSPFDGFAIGGLVQFAHTPQRIIDIVTAVRKIIPKEKPVHAFGVFNPLLIPILIKLGVDSFDSSSYIRLALERKFFIALCKEKITLHSNITALKMPCFCPICKNIQMEVFLEKTIKAYAFLALHNLHEIESLVRYCKILMVEGKLDTLIKECLQKLGSKIDQKRTMELLRHINGRI